MGAWFEWIPDRIQFEDILGGWMPKRETPPPESVRSHPPIAGKYRRICDGIQFGRMRPWPRDGPALCFAFSEPRLLQGRTHLIAVYWRLLVSPMLLSNVLTSGRIRVGCEMRSLLSEWCWELTSCGLLDTVFSWMC